MKRRSFLRVILTATLSFGFLGRILRLGFPVAAEAQTGTITRLAYGSCLYQTEPQPVWEAIQLAKAQVFTFIGDNIYADTEDMAKMKKDYEILAAVPSFAKLRKKIPVIGTWDDHDFGKNDGGCEYPKIKEAKELMLDFFGEPKGTERRKREGVYTSYFYGEAPNRLQVILLDLRTFRTALKLRTTELWGYEPNPDPAATIMGKEQWAWLEAQLKLPADLRIFCSSIQLVPSDHEWEKWANFPLEKARLYSLIDRLRLRNLFVVSGDMHFAELSSEKTPGGIEIFDLTASGMNFGEKKGNVPNSKRIFFKDNFAHFGNIQIDWAKPAINVQLEIRDEKNKLVFGKAVSFPRGSA